MRDRYQKNKHLVDLAARLTAFNVVDIRVCETRMGVLGQPVSSLVPFVSTVPFGPAEVDRLVNEEEYLYF
jgi:intracellular sulfur oxidation DsrE/DsrF family protein